MHLVARSCRVLSGQVKRELTRGGAPHGMAGDHGQPAAVKRGERTVIAARCRQQQTLVIITYAAHTSFFARIAPM
jgi:hypothetical protein